MEKKKTVKADANANVSKSKAKREERRKEVQKAKRSAYAARTTGFVLAAVIALVIVGAVGKKVYIMAIRTTPNEDYSAGLTDDGRIEDADMASMVTLADYRNISLPEDEIAASEDEVAAEIDSVLEPYQELSTDEQMEIADGDTVNIDFVGTVDGEEFDGGSSEGAGYDLTIGSGSFVDDFEEQLIGHKPGEEVTVDVTFPENYSEELAGKDASFAVTVNGIMVTPELTDDFVAENLADTEEVSTAAEYRAKVENDIYQEHLEEYLKEYVLENSTVNSYPKKYVKAQKSLLKYEDGDIEDEDEISYEKELTERAQETVKEAMIYQALFEDAGLIYDADAHYAEMVEEMGEEYAQSDRETYGAGYLAQEEIRQMAIDYLVNLY